MTTAVPRNANFAKLQAGYLFPEIARRRNAYLAENPDAKIISLGIGDTTQPIPKHILAGLTGAAAGLGTAGGYSGYGDGNGNKELREKIAGVLYEGVGISADEVFVSDGAKCDIQRVQLLFGEGVSVAVQDPSYPVYVDTSVMLGRTGGVNSNSQFEKIVYMNCGPANDFFPDFEKTERADVIFFCSPNNPTGAVASRKQLEELVAFAKKNGSIIVYDAAYAPFIRNPDIPKSIFEVEGAVECAIECNSFSKYAGFTGVRLGWTIVPKALKFADGTLVHTDYNRIMATCFNGASNIVQGGGLNCLDKEGQQEISDLMDYYLGNAAILRECMEKLGYSIYGGIDSPYVWVDLQGKKSWDVFEELMHKAQVVTIPGVGFGPGGEGFLRLSAFASRDNCIAAAERLTEALAK
eukprot:CAMPEP_0174895390 /NCGR_PEP_ID=MMETSP0167-20121228/9812_1 /TAXON_ID=38298 /ORGANISM="Rhodella maculata, Strain CCMP736" /LENGTH=408 /DNA_ID=CAMNT_0016134711 /DNA_START=21 /DNA_END=1247 /DNA_ORIENTATION=+